MLQRSTVERPRTANETTAPKIETQQAVGRARDTDPFALANFVWRLTIGSEPQRAGSAKVGSVQSAIDLQCLAQPSWAPREVSQPFGAAISRHDPDAQSWLDCADQDARSYAGRLARDVQHERGPISEIDVSVPVREEECSIARCHAAPGVAGGIADLIRLGFDDTAAHHAFGQNSNNHFTDQKSRHLDGIDRQLRPFQQARERHGRAGVSPSAQPIARA